MSNDPVIIDLNRYLDAEEEAIEEAEAEELRVYQERLKTAERLLAREDSDEHKARLIVAWMEEEIEESQDAYY